jgi:hypothetical protein
MLLVAVYFVMPVYTLAELVEPKAVVLRIMNVVTVQCRVCTAAKNLHAGLFHVADIVLGQDRASLILNEDTHTTPIDDGARGKD